MENKWIRFFKYHSGDYGITPDVPPSVLPHFRFCSLRAVSVDTLMSVAMHCLATLQTQDYVCVGSMLNEHRRCWSSITVYQVNRQHRINFGSLSTTPT